MPINQMGIYDSSNPQKSEGYLVVFSFPVFQDVILRKAGTIKENCTQARKPTKHKDTFFSF